MRLVGFERLTLLVYVLIITVHLTMNFGDTFHLVKRTYLSLNLQLIGDTIDGLVQVYFRVLLSCCEPIEQLLDHERYWIGN